MSYIYSVCSQILVDTQQKKMALKEIEARHLEILTLEQNIRVGINHFSHACVLNRLRQLTPCVKACTI